MGKFSAKVKLAGGGVSGFAKTVGSSKLAVAALSAALIYGAYKLYDYASGAKAIREALEGMNKTASAWKRQEFLRMIDMCQRGEIDIILTKSISRFGRNTEDTLTALRTIKETGTCIIFDEEGIDTRVEDSELMISLLSAYAQAENESRRQNQLWGIKKRLQDGSSDLYRRPCYGFRKKDDNELMIEPHEAGIVQNIYQMYLDGASIIGIQRQLATNGVLSPSGKLMWSKRSIDQILQNEKYIGDAVVFKTYSISSKRVINNDGSHEQFVIRGNHPAIITQEIFNAAQRIRNQRSNVYHDEAGTHRKSTKYSSKRNIANNSEIKY